MTDEMAAALVPIGHLDAIGPCHVREQRSEAAIPAVVTSIWRSEVRETGVLHVVPDGCVEIIRSADGVVEVWGPSVGPRRVPVERGAAYDGVRIRVGAAAAVLGVPVDSLAGEVVAAAELGSWGRSGIRDRQQWLTRILAQAADATAAWRADPVAVLAPVWLGRPGTRIPAVAAGLGIGERQLRRRFRSSVGLSPSAYRRLVRTRYALRDLSTSDPEAHWTIADIAHHRGFADQSHLTKEVVALTGLTPARLR